MLLETALIGVCCLAGVGTGAEQLARAGLPTHATGSSTNLPLKQIGPGLFELGQVRLDKRQKTVSFPAVMNLNEGVIEYLVVTSSGKTHESLLRTDAQPYHLHLALLLLDAKGAGTNSFPEDNARPLPGDKVTLEVSWRTGGKEKRHRAEELVHDRKTKSPMSKGAWVHNGSRIVEGTFMAQQDGSIISLISDPEALINNPRPGREDDDNWQVSSSALPPLNAPVQVTIRLPSTKP